MLLIWLAEIFYADYMLLIAGDKYFILVIRCLLQRIIILFRLYVAYMIGGIILCWIYSAGFKL